MTIKEQAAYLKGMLKGMDLDEDRNETKLFKGIIDAIENLSNSFENLDEDVDGILDQLEVMDVDLAEVENEVFEDGCECGCDCDCENDCHCGCHDDDEECYEVVCPTCGEKICISEEILDEEEMSCPNCGELLEFDLSDCDCDCCCGCECDCDDDCDCECDDDCDCGCKSCEDDK